MKKVMMFVLAAALTISMAGCGSKTEETEKPAEKVTEAVTETKTEAATETETEAENEVKTEAATEAETEAKTEVAMETDTEAVTEAETEAKTETETEQDTEYVASAAFVADADKETEEMTEAEATETVTEAGETEEVTEAATEATEMEAAETETETTETETEATETEVTEALTEAAGTEDVTEAAEAELETEEFVVPEGTKYKAVLLVNGSLGDKSFFDSANAGLAALQEELGEEVFEFKVEEMGGTSADMAKYEPIMYDYCDDGSYDVIICGAYQMLDALTNAANDYPDQKFIFFDEAFDFEACDNENVYNVMFRQNEVSYLVGAAAAMMTTDADLEMIDPDNKIIGFLGGMDSSVINDFLVGYIEGAKAVEPDVEVAIAYVGDYIDSAKGKDMALTQYQNGADVGFNVAGSAGLGQIEAAADAGKYAFGVDSDQAALLSDYAAHIPTSALKNVGNALITAIKKDILGELSYGSLEYMGFAEGGVELVLDEHYEEMVPADIREEVANLQQQIESGEIVVDSTLGDNPISTEDYDALIQSVKVK